MACLFPMPEVEMNKVNFANHSGEEAATLCDQEPIHILGKVQSFGCLLAVSNDWIVIQVSKNAEEILGLTAQDILGTRFADLFTVHTSHKLRGKTQPLSSANPQCRVFGFDVFEDGRQFDVSVHANERGFVYEFEPKQDADRRDDLSIVQPLISRIRSKTEIPELLKEATSGLRALTGFDRVMIYRFAPDGTGSVVAETCDSTASSYAGLRFPASDIPKQARALYKRTPLRLIADVDAPVSEIIPGKSPEGDPLDLSLSVTRAVSPTHLQYLRNMGVTASMSVSIMQRGELWGLIACHHNQPHYLDYEMRTAVELYGQLFSYELADRIHEQERVEIAEARTLHNRVMSRIADGTDLFASFEILSDEIWDVISFDGIALFSKETYQTLGIAPTEAEFGPLARFLNTAAQGKVFSTDRLADIFEGAGAISDRVSGLLAIPISRDPRDYIVLFRGELSRIVNWAGNPNKPMASDSAEGRLTPRKSFEAWSSIVAGQCAPWNSAERRAADFLRITLLEVVLKVTSRADELQVRQQQRQELLIAELNHRVRNTLNLIQGIVSQGRSNARTMDAFADVLNGRIQALARAHDQLTEVSWGPSSLKKMIMVEAEAFQDRMIERIVVNGNDVLLDPTALSALALVVHELFTNAVKYGALSVASGSVDLNLSLENSGDLKVDWIERGGPAVQAPTSEGFGSKIIRNSIAFELNGRAELSYRLSGITAQFWIPKTLHVPSDEDVADIEFIEASEDITLPTPCLDGDVLLVEDNLIIALAAQDMLTDLGAKDVFTAPSVAQATRIIEDRHVDFAVLDVNLGRETSAPVAIALRAKGIPFILATGYGTFVGVDDSYPSCDVLKKPYCVDALRRVIGEAKERHDQTKDGHTATGPAAGAVR